jgi:hypothetical protein
MIRSTSPSSRPAAGRPVRSARRDPDSRLLSVLSRVTERDRVLCRLLYEHRVLTTPQVTDVAFSGERRARTRLADLYALEVVDRFRPQTWSTPAPFHWLLGPLGATLVAAERGSSIDDLDWRSDLVRDLAVSQRLTHLVGVNGFFAALIRTARTRPDCQLEEWWSERRCAREWGEVVRPDAYAIWIEHGIRLPFLLEYDNGTERLSRLAAKLEDYTALAAAAGHPNWVLFTFPTARREHEARAVLDQPGVPVATTALASGTTPDEAVWLPVGRRTPRVRLVDLATTDPGRR